MLTLGDLESNNMSGCSSSISSQTLGAGIGGVVVGLLIGAVISCVTTKIVWGAPNMKRCQKSSKQSKLKYVKICDYTCIPDTEFSTKDFDYYHSQDTSQCSIIFNILHVLYVCMYVPFPYIC